MLLLYELEVNGCTLVLLLFAVELEQVLRDFKSFEGLVGKAHLFTTGEKDEDLLFLVCFEEAEKRVKFIFNRQLHIIVQQSRRCDRLEHLFVLRCSTTLCIRIYTLISSTTLNRIKVMNLDEFCILAQADSCEISQ